MSALSASVTPAADSLSVGKRVRPGVLRQVRREVAAALAFLGLIALVAIVGPLVSPRDPLRTAVVQRLTPPMWQERGNSEYPLGTDALGRDILTRIVYGARISVLIGLAAVLLGGSVGVAAGLLAGFYGGKLDALIMRLGDIQLALPFILLALAIMAALGVGLWNVIVVLSLGQWVEYARVVRGEVLGLREREFVQAARVVGQRDPAILLRHILPNVAAPIIVIASLSVGTVILGEASLTFLGAGVPSDTPTWGGMIADGRDYMTSAGWIATVPGIVLMLTILCINVVGDWLRDVLDPRTRNAR